MCTILEVPEKQAAEERQNKEKGTHEKTLETKGSLSRDATMDLPVKSRRQERGSHPKPAIRATEV